jgi:hypothetical protein
MTDKHTTRQNNGKLAKKFTEIKSIAVIVEEVILENINVIISKQRSI